MQGVLVKPCVYVPVVLNSRKLCARVPGHSEVPTSLPYSLKTTFPYLKLKNTACVFQVRAMSTQFVKETQPHNLYYNPQHLLQAKRGSSCLCKASKGNPQKSEKPKWWWRSLAALPYLIGFVEQQTWTLAHPNNPPPFLENFDEFFFPLLSTFYSLPKFILAAYTLILYFWIVRRKEWPHFLRFHVMIGILMGVLVQCIGISSNWLPTWAYPPHFWSIATFVLVVTILECIRCALTGCYSSLPFMKDAAFLHADLNLR